MTNNTLTNNTLTPDINTKILAEDCTKMSGDKFRDSINRAIPSINQWSFNMDLEWPSDDDNQWETYYDFYVFSVTIEDTTNVITKFWQEPKTMGQSYDLILSLSSVTSEDDTVSPPSCNAIRQFNNIAHVTMQSNCLKFYCYSKEQFLDTALQLRGTFVPSYLPQGCYYSTLGTASTTKVIIPAAKK